MAALSSPVALVTGSRGGIGRAIVQSLTGAGFTVVGLDASPDLAGNAAIELCVDVADESACRTAVDEAMRHAGRVDAVVCAAGVNLRVPFASLDLPEARRVFDVNVWGTVHVLRAARQPLVASGRGSVVIITSTSGQLGFANSSVYAMSKMALTGLIRSLAVEWAPDGIRVNAVAPAIVPTAMNADVRQQAGYVERKVSGIPLGRMIEPREVADAVVFLAGTGSAGITGHVLNVDGGAVIKG